MPPNARGMASSSIVRSTRRAAASFGVRTAGMDRHGFDAAAIS
jgi:hypothetical protein